MSGLVDHDLIDRLRSGDCCVENNDDAAEHIGILADEIERLTIDNKKMHSEIRSMVAIWEKAEKHITKLEAELQKHIDFNRGRSMP